MKALPSSGFSVLLAVCLYPACATTIRAGDAMPQTVVNSLGMKLVRIEPGNFMMGQDRNGDWDERPVHKVNITQPYYMAVTEVTNAQYEQFDKEHRP